LNPPGQKYPAPSLRVKKPLIPPGEKAPATCSNRYTPPLGTLSKAAYLERLKNQPQHRRMMGPTTSALVRPAPPFSRPPPGAALRVMPPKKRVKIDQDENDSDSSCQSKNDDSKNTDNVNNKRGNLTKVILSLFLIFNLYLKSSLLLPLTTSQSVLDYSGFPARLLLVIVAQKAFSILFNCHQQET